MITAHLPAGYALAKTARWRGPVMAAALVGAVFPDIDLIWFYFIDDRAVHHHRYWVHAPAFALMVSAALYACARMIRPDLAPLVLAFGAGWGLHILLDAPVGGIMWLWPFDQTLFAPIAVAATHGHWLVFFAFHWSILLEVLVGGMALILFASGRKAAP